MVFTGKSFVALTSLSLNLTRLINVRVGKGEVKMAGYWPGSFFFARL